MDTSIACPRCGANLVFQSNLDSTASQTVCDFCGAHLSVTYENSVPQFTLIPEPEMAAPDLSQFSPETTPDSGTANLNESVPPPDPSPEPALEPTPEPTPVYQEVIQPPAAPYTPVQQSSFSSFDQQEPPQKKKTNPWLIVAIVIVAVLCLCCVCGGAGVFWFINSGQSGSSFVPTAALFF
jgi:hypothetical protein